MNKKPEGPIYIDNSTMLMKLPVEKLVLLANIAMNKLTCRDIGEIGYYIGVEFDLKLEDKDDV